MRRSVIKVENWQYTLAYTGYISISCFVAYPLLKWKEQAPKTWGQVFSVFLVNCLILGLLPLLPFLMRTPPKKKSGMSAFESEDYNQYHTKGRIWFWQKP